MAVDAILGRKDRRSESSLIVKVVPSAVTPAPGRPRRSQGTRRSRRSCRRRPARRREGRTWLRPRTSPIRSACPARRHPAIFAGRPGFLDPIGPGAGDWVVSGLQCIVLVRHVEPAAKLSGYPVGLMEHHGQHLQSSAWRGRGPVARYRRRAALPQEPPRVTRATVGLAGEILYTWRQGRPAHHWRSTGRMVPEVPSTAIARTLARIDARQYFAKRGLDRLPPICADPAICDRNR